jgi:hypothetical protein
VIFLHGVFCADSGRVREFTGIIDCLQKTITTEGLYAVYYGVQVAVLEVVVYRVCHGLLFILPRRLVRTTRSVRLSCILQYRLLRVTKRALKRTLYM